MTALRRRKKCPKPPVLAEPAAWGWCMEDDCWLFAAEIFRYEQINHVVDGLRVGARVDAGREPVGIRAGEVFLQRVKIAAVAELNMIGRSHRVVAEEQIGKFARIVGGLVYIAGKRRSISCPL